MKNSKLSAVAALLLCAVSVAQAQTPIKKGQPAFTVKLTKNEMYSVDDLNAGIARMEKNLLVRLNPQLGQADKEKARIEYLAAVKPKLLDAQIGEAMFRQFCDREKIQVSDADVAKYIARLKAQLGASSESDGALEQALAVNQGVVLDLKTYARQRLLLRNYIQSKRAAELKALKAPTPEEILAAYEEMKPNLLVPETARISIVFIDYGKKGPEERKKAQDTMRGLAAKVKDDKSAFDKLLLGSLDPSAGYLAKTSYVVMNIKEGAYDPEFVGTVFALKPGEISGLIESSNGLQIIRLNDKSEAKQLALYDAVPGANNLSVQDLIAEQLVGLSQESYSVKVFAEIMNQLRGEAAVTIMQENLRGILGDAELEGIAARYAKKK